jgi:hypothetical protein
LALNYYNQYLKETGEKAVNAGVRQNSHEHKISKYQISKSDNKVGFTWFTFFTKVA